MAISTNVESLLTKALDSRLLLPNTADYQTRNSSYYSAFQNELKPSHIVTPNSVQDVCNIVKTLRPMLFDGHLKMAIRGGGHTPFAGSSNIDNGITIDMSNLKGISVNEDKSVVTIGAGEDWAGVYTMLDSHGLTTAGGRGGKIGVAGLTLGGGLSFYSTRRGFACDQVVDFEIVVASGDIIHANAQENPDLLFALRGGLNNFGIVTSLKMKTFKAGPIWGGTIFYQAEAFPQLMEHACEFVTEDKDPDTHMMYFLGFGYGRKFAMCRIYSMSGIENPPSLHRFTSMELQIKEMSTVRKSTHLDFCEEFTEHAVLGKRQLFMTCTIQADYELTEAFRKAWEETVAKIEDCDGLFLPFIYNPLTKTLLQESIEAGGNAMSISPDDGPLFVILLGPIWDSPDDDNRVITASLNLLETCQRLARDRGKLHPFLFPNYAYSTQDVFAGYGEGLSRMRETSKKWDPEQIFQKGVPGGFKLF